LATLCALGTDLTVSGNRLGRLGSRRLRYPVRFVFHQASDWVVDDPDGRCGLLVDDLAFDQALGGIVLTGPLPGRLYVRTACRQVTVQTSATPLRRSTWCCG
jgi:hypothetical protein